ncbi:MAG TPA: hypothetical protein VNV37_03920, partial [Solirubrobacteraceae bacterium]|nr:hypothetical protein [Solirubrobacteraceae bacterium]
AIANAILFSLSRIPNATGVTRILEDTSSDHSNLNRYQLLRRSEVGEWKVKALQQADLGKLRVTGSPVRYDERSRARVGTLAPVVLVGVDHIPTRWFIQTQHDGWLAIGATTHWSAMASFHHPENACAMCLHPHDDPTDTLVPTVAFVSFWSGLLAAAYFARRAAGEQIALAEQQVFLTPLRPESAWKAPVSRRLGCPICGEREARVVDDAAA